MSSAIAISSAVETKWTVVRGPMKGVVRLMSLTQFSIGRSTDCEFVIVNDPKCSRKHVIILVTANGIEAISQNENNLALVNGKEVDRARLRDGDILTLGETEVQFNVTNTHQTAQSHLAVARPYQGQPAMQPISSQGMPRRSSRKPKSSSARLVIYFLVGLFFLWIFTGKKQKTPAIDIRTDQKIQADIEAANKLKEQGEAAAAKKLDNSVTARQAQEQYVSGFRDYQKGQFERSLTHFQACLALYPDHVLCNRYIRLAQRRLNELIQIEVLLGRKYRDQNQYRACMAAFQNVTSMVKDANSPIYKEALANFNACKSFVEGRF